MQVFIQRLDEVNTPAGVGGCAGSRGARLPPSMSEANGSTRSPLSPPYPTPEHFIQPRLQKASLVLLSHACAAPDFCMTRLEGSIFERMEVREISRGSSPMISRGSRCWWEYFVTASGNARPPIHTWAIRSENPAQPILSRSISCPHKCQAPSVSYSSTLSSFFFPRPLPLSIKSL